VRVPVLLNSSVKASVTQYSFAKAPAPHNFSVRTPEPQKPYCEGTWTSKLLCRVAWTWTYSNLFCLRSKNYQAMSNPPSISFTHTPINSLPSFSSQTKHMAVMMMMTMMKRCTIVGNVCEILLTWQKRKRNDNKKERRRSGSGKEEEKVEKKNINFTFSHYFDINLSAFCQNRFLRREVWLSTCDWVMMRIGFCETTWMNSLFWVVRMWKDFGLLELILKSKMDEFNEHNVRLLCL